MYEMIEQYKPSDNERKYLVTYRLYINNDGTYNCINQYAIMTALNMHYH